jgi:hypothetical protein
MANLRKPLRRALLPLAVLGFAACQSDRSPIGPEAVAPESASPQFVEVNGVKLVTAKPGRALLLADVDFAIQRVPRNVGGTLTTDDATLTILPGSMQSTTIIWMLPDLDSGYVQFRFGPTGTTFTPAATLRIDADEANIPAAMRNRLRVAGASDNVDNWTLVGGSYDPVTNTVKAPISHFSRYALCVE